MLSVGCGGGQVEIVDVRMDAVSTRTPIHSSGKVRPPTSIPTPTPATPEVVVRKAIVEQLVEAKEYVASFKEVPSGDTQPLPDIETTISPMPRVTPTPTPVPPTSTPVPGPTATPKIVIKEVELDSGVSCTEFIRVNKAISTDAYEGDLVSGWEFGLKHSNGFMSHGCQIVSSDDGYPTRDGKYSLRFEVRDGDCNSNEGRNDCETDRSRHELTQVDNHKKGQDFQYEGDEYWYKWSMLMPDKPIKQGEAISFIGQFNSDNAARFYMEDFSKGVGYRFNDVDYNILEQNVLIKNEHVRSVWTDIEIHALWSSTDYGFIKIYVNEELTGTVKGPNMEGANRIWFDFGIYNAFLSRCDCKKMPTQVVYFDGIRRGASRMDVD